MNDYEKAFQLKDPKYRSSALLYATGMDEEDLKKPFVAVIGSFSEMVPGHMHMRELAEAVKRQILSRLAEL